VGINGYSPIRPRALSEAFCFDPLSETCAEAAERLFSRSNDGLPDLASLMKLNRLVVEHGPAAETMLRLSPAGWTRIETSTYADIYRLDRRAEPGLPGSVAWVSPGVSISPTRLGETSESYRVEVPPTGATIVFARPYSRGFRASLDNVPIEVSAARGILVSLRLPGGSGSLRLDYWPRELSLGLLIAGLCLVLAVAIVCCWSWREAQPRRTLAPIPDRG